MIATHRFLCCFLIIVAPLASAGTATNSKDLAKSLKGKIVFLRGMEAGDTLTFDAQGAEVGSYRTESFAYSTIKVKKVRFSAAQLTIEGERAALVFNSKSDSPSLNDIEYVPLKEKVDVIVGLDAGHPEVLGNALGKIFSANADEALNDLSSTARRTALYSLGSTAQVDRLMQTPYKPGHGVSPPRLTYFVDPNFSSEARNEKIGGVCVVGLIVDTTGRPEHIRILRPAGHGLDINAIIAVSQYHFAPAQDGGIAVPVAINIQVNFRVY